MTAATAWRIGNTLEIKTPMLGFFQGQHERWLRVISDDDLMQGC